MTKVLVCITEPNGDDNWGKYKLNEANEIEIRPGRGDWCELPKYDLLAERRDQGTPFPIPFVGPWRIWRQKYVRYNRLSKKLVLRSQDADNPVDWAFINKLLKGKALSAYTDDSNQVGMLEYVSLALLGALFFFLVVMPNFK